MAHRKNKPEPPIVIEGNQGLPYFQVGEMAQLIHPIHGWTMRKVCINSCKFGQWRFGSGEIYIGYSYNVSSEGALEDRADIAELFLKKDYEAGNWYELGTSIGWGENVINIKDLGEDNDENI